MNNRLTIIILAGGLGKRMKSPLPKVLHEINGTPMLVMVIREAIKLNPSKIIVVVGQYKNIIEQTLIKYDLLKYINFSIQENPLGTGDAVLCTLNNLSELENDYSIILNGDSPFLSSNTISDIINIFENNETDMQITSINSINPTGCGRIIKNEFNEFQQIVEEKDCNIDQRKITEINIGIYVVKNNTLKKYIPLIKNENSQKEYYLTDIVMIYRSMENKQVGLIKLPDSKMHEISNINTIEQLNEFNK